MAKTAYASLRDYIRIKFRDLRLDLVIANAAPALQFVLRYRDELFPGVPWSLPPRRCRGGAPGRGRGRHRHLARAVPGRNTGTGAEDPSSDEALHVIAYAPAVDGFQQRVRATLARVLEACEVTYSNEPTLPEMLATSGQLPADSLIFYVRYSPVTKGRVIFPDEMLPEIAEAAPVPIYSQPRHEYRQRRASAA